MEQISIFNFKFCPLIAYLMEVKVFSRIIADETGGK